MWRTGNDPLVETSDPQLAAIVTLTMGLGVAMAWLGTRLGLLEMRNGRRRCPSCGHLVNSATRCPCARS
jgi:hypothetical protein